MAVQSMHRNQSGHFNTACVHISRCGGYIKQTGGVERAFESKPLCKYRSTEAKGAPFINTQVDGQVKQLQPPRSMLQPIYVNDRSFTNSTQWYNHNFLAHIYIVDPAWPGTIRFGPPQCPRLWQSSPRGYTALSCACSLNLPVC